MPTISLYNALWICVTAMGLHVIWMCVQHWRTMRLLEEAVRGRVAPAAPAGAPAASPRDAASTSASGSWGRPAAPPRGERAGVDGSDQAFPPPRPRDPVPAAPAGRKSPADVFGPSAAGAIAPTVDPISESVEIKSKLFGESALDEPAGPVPIAMARPAEAPTAARQPAPAQSRAAQASQPAEELRAGHPLTPATLRAAPASQPLEAGLAGRQPAPTGARAPQTSQLAEAETAGHEPVPAPSRSELAGAERSAGAPASVSAASSSPLSTGSVATVAPPGGSGPAAVTRRTSGPVRAPAAGVDALSDGTSRPDAVSNLRSSLDASGPRSRPGASRAGEARPGAGLFDDVERPWATNRPSSREQPAARTHPEAVAPVEAPAGARAGGAAAAIPAPHGARPPIGAGPTTAAGAIGAGGAGDRLGAAERPAVPADPATAAVPAGTVPERPPTARGSLDWAIPPAAGPALEPSPTPAAGARAIPASRARTGDSGPISRPWTGDPTTSAAGLELITGDWPGSGTPAGGARSKIVKESKDPADWSRPSAREPDPLREPPVQDWPSIPSLDAAPVAPARREPMLDKLHAFAPGAEQPAAARGNAGEVLRRVLARTRPATDATSASHPDPGAEMMARGQFEEAARYFARRADSDSGTEEDFRALGKALANLGRMDEAVAAWERMHARFPGRKP